MVQTVNQLLGLLTVFGHGILVIFLLGVFIKTNKDLQKLFKFVNKNALLFSWIVALVATLGSLFYSDVAGYEPCKLCWYQRIFMYPQVFLLGMAMKLKDNSIVKYALMLSIIGAALAGYHYLLQLNLAPNLPCSAVGYSVSCSQRFVMQFGYITIPLMSLTAFLLIIFFLSSQKFLKK